MVLAAAVLLLHTQMVSQSVGVCEFYFLCFEKFTHLLLCLHDSNVSLYLTDSKISSGHINTEPVLQHECRNKTEEN